MIDEGISGEDFEATLESAPRDLSGLGELLMDVRRGYKRSRRSLAAEANTTDRYLGRVERGEVRPSEAWLSSWGRAMALSETGLGRLLVAYRSVPDCAEETPTPVCGAGPGQQCSRPDGTETSWIHVERGSAT